jgi:hypothetical protein
VCGDVSIPYRRLLERGFALLSFGYSSLYGGRIV